VPRFFFDLYDGEVTTDKRGLELPDSAAARREAARTLSEIALDEFPGNGSHKDLSIVVRSSLDIELFRVTVRLTVEGMVWSEGGAA